MNQRKLYAYHFLFALAIVSVALGSGLLVMTTERMTGFRVVWPLIILVAGALFSYFAIIARWRAKLVFLGLLLTCSALIRFVATVLGLSAAIYWPLYAVAAGACLLPASFLRYGKTKPSSVVLSASFAMLGVFFSIFSFGFSSMSFKTFLARWWPALFIASGLVLLLTWMVQRLVLKSSADPRDEGKEPGSDGGEA
ncbi:MAG: hypothetical protein KKA67_01725 [Spirochaetes bacterium]|nr:hypothetical protein [Spirochaetota bacterium]MBU1080831.1 hypothetical protein [Spirochaetota bacterium]